MLSQHGQFAGQTDEKTYQFKASRAKARTYISITTKREVWKRTDKMCTYVNSETGKRCCSKHGIEIDHIIPLARGGTDDPSNLTILCDTHNRFKGTAFTETGTDTGTDTETADSCPRILLTENPPR